MDDPEALSEPAQPQAAPPVAEPPPRARRMPIWAALVASLAGVLVAFAAGYAINADDAGAASERDDLSEELDRASAAGKKARAALAVAQDAIDECQAAVEEAATLADDATDFVGDWQAMKGLGFDYAATPVGSPEESQIDEQIAQLTLQMDTKVGALTASAGRVGSNRACLET